MIFFFKLFITFANVEHFFNFHQNKIIFFVEVSEIVDELQK